MLRATVVTALLLVLAGTAFALPPGEHRPFKDGANHHIGDDSFVAMHGRAPTREDSERERMHDHLSYIHDVLAKHPATTPALQKRRDEILGYLADYVARGITPKNTYVPWRTPVFIDRDNTICAVGYLIAKTSGRPLAEKIAQKHRLSYIEDIAAAEPEVKAWIASSGLSLEEIASIQPGYMGPSISFEGGFIAADVKDGAYREEPAETKVVVTGEFAKGKMTGPWQITDDGKVIGAGAMHAGAGTWRSSYPDGTHRAEGKFADNRAHGTWRFFHPSGRLAAEGPFVKGRRAGMWTFYYDDEAHTVISRGPFDDGAITGWWRHYDAAGKLLATAGMPILKPLPGVDDVRSEPGLLVTVTAGKDGVVHERHGGLPAESYRLDGYYAGKDRLFVDENGAMWDEKGDELTHDNAWAAGDCHWSKKRKTIAETRDLTSVHEMLMADRGQTCDAAKPVSAERAQRLDHLLAASVAVREPAPAFVAGLSSHTDDDGKTIAPTDLAAVIADHMTWYMEWPFIDDQFVAAYSTMPGYGDSHRTDGN